MIKILWFSRHAMTPQQIDALEYRLGKIEVTQLDGTMPNVHIPFTAKQSR